MGNEMIALRVKINHISVGGGALELVEGGNHQHGDLLRRRVRAQALANLETADLGHHDIEENEIGLPVLDLAQGLLTICSRVNVTFDAAEIGFEKLDSLSIVIGDEDARPHGCVQGRQRRRGGRFRTLHGPYPQRGVAGPASNYKPSLYYTEPQIQQHRIAIVAFSPLTSTKEERCWKIQHLGKFSL